PTSSSLPTAPASRLRAFTAMPVGGEFEFIPLLIDDNGDCRAGKLTMTLKALDLDLSDVSNLSDLEAVFSDNSSPGSFSSVDRLASRSSPRWSVPRWAVR